MILRAAAGILLGLVVSAFGAPIQDELPQKTLQALKAATAFIRVKAAFAAGTGSGFLIRRDGDIGYLVTNSHVVSFEEGSHHQVTVVFDSSLGSERSVKATVVAEDPAVDLAILRVELKNLPAPIEWDPQAEVKESAPIIVLGYPFGADLATNGANPAITIGKGTVTKLLPKTPGVAEGIQIDGDVNPGNSGGPMVSPAGKLMAVTVSKIVNSRVAFGIPLESLAGVLAGRVSRCAFTDLENRNGTAKVLAEALLLDPFRVAKSVTLLWVPSDQVTAKPQPDPKGGWLPVAKDMQEFQMEVKGDYAKCEMTLQQAKRIDVIYTFQFRLTKNDGSVLITAPREERVDFTRGYPPSVEAADWIGKAGRPYPVTTTFPAPEPSTEDLGIAIPKGDVSCFKLKMDVDDVVTNGILWSKEGNAVFVLQAKGILHRIAYPSLKEEKRLVIGKTCKAFDRSKEGLAVIVDGLQELWLVDEATLAVKKAVAVGGTHAIVCNPVTSHAYLSQGKLLSVVDLAACQLVRQHGIDGTVWPAFEKLKKPKDANTYSFAIQYWNGVRVSPDGKYLFAIGASLNRFRINGPELAYDEIGMLIQPSGFVSLSGDSRTVAVEVRGTTEIPGFPKFGEGAWVFRVDDLSKPTGAITTGLSALIYQANGKMIGAPNNGGPLVLMSPAGVSERTLKLGERGFLYRNLTLSPSGNQLAVSLDKEALVLDLERMSGPSSSPAPVPSPAPSPAPSAARKALVDAKVASIPVEGGRMIPSLQWSADGKSVFFLHQKGTLTKCSVEDMKEEKKIELARNCWSLGRCKEGLLVLAASPDELLLLDETLVVKTKVAVAGGMGLASVPVLSLAYVTDNGASNITVVDMKSGKIVKQVGIKVLYDQRDKAKYHTSAAPVAGWSKATFTPDGAYMICTNGDSLHRLKVEGTEFKLEEVGPRLGRAPNFGGAIISADSKYVAFLSNGPSGGINDHPPLSGGIYVYKINDLQAPLLAVSGWNDTAMCAGFDKAGGRIYLGGQKGVNSYDPRGLPLKQYALGNQGSCQQILVHPSGGRFAALTYDGVYVVDLPK